MRVVSAGLLNPYTVYFEATLSPGFCPSILNNISPLRRQADTFLLLLEVFIIFAVITCRQAVNGRGFLAFKQEGAQAFTSLRYDSRLERYVTYELHWSRDFPLIVMNSLGILLPVVIATVVIVFATKVLDGRWRKELEQFEQVTLLANETEYT